MRDALYEPGCKSPAPQDTDNEALVSEIDAIKVSIGARLDSMSEAQKEVAVNQAWHRLNAIVSALRGEDDGR